MAPVTKRPRSSSKAESSSGATDYEELSTPPKKKKILIKGRNVSGSSSPNRDDHDLSSMNDIMNSTTLVRINHSPVRKATPATNLLDRPANISRPVRIIFFYLLL